MKYFFANRSLGILVVSFLILPVFVLAATPTIQSLLAWAWIPLYLLLLAIMALALVFFLWGVAIFILNAGNEEKRSEGRQKMFWGIIALAVMIAIWGIVRLLASVFLPFGGAPLPPIFLPDVLPR